MNAAVLPSAPDAAPTDKTGGSSASLIVPVPVGVPSLAFVADDRATVNASSGSSLPSVFRSTRTVPALSPGANVNVPDADA